MTSVVVFTGPTLPAHEAESRLRLADALFLAPAALGDVYRSCAARPWGIVLIDGHFDHRLSVWHKEILWALAQGIRVYGAASMGALRAAELAAFGMVGVGEVFRAFAAGVLEDDDEVAVAHGAAEDGFRPTSEALVNVRATLARAVEEQVIGAADHEALIAVAKALFYPERRLAAVIARARSRAGDDVTPGALAALESWLGPAMTGGRRARMVDQKRLDAIAVLDRVRADASDLAASRRPPPAFRFAYTEAWHELRTAMNRRGQ